MAVQEGSDGEVVVQDSSYIGCSNEAADDPPGKVLYVICFFDNLDKSAMEHQYLVTII